MRVALVTGAARGIGAATVRRLVAEGVHVTALDWCVGDGGLYPQANEPQLRALAAQSKLIHPFIGDVRDIAALQAAVEDTLSRWGRLDVAVAAAGLVGGGMPLWETDTAELELLWDVNGRGVWNTAAAVMPVMLGGPDPSGCRFVAVVSTAGVRGHYRLAAYNAAKHAAIGIVRGLAADLVGTGVTAVAVSPGSTDTAMLSRTAQLYDVRTEELAQAQLLQRLLLPDEVAAAIVLCCSREGAILNGSVVHADGGSR